MKNNKGFVPVLVLVIILGVLIVGGVAYFIGKNTVPENNTSDNSNNYSQVDQQLVSNQTKEEAQKEVITTNNYFDNLKEIKVTGEIKGISDSGIVITSDRLIFLDEAGNIKKEDKVSKDTVTQISKNGNLIGQTTPYGITEKGPNGFNFKMFNKNMKLLWETSKFGGGPYGISEINGGSVIMLDCVDGDCHKDLVIFSQNNPNGKVIKTSLSPIANATGIDISADGNYFVVGYQTPSSSYPIDYSNDFYLVLFDINGKQLWKYSLPNSWGNEMSLSPHGNYVVSTIRTNKPKKNQIHIFNKRGEVVMKYAVPYVGNYIYKFSDDEKQVVASSSNGELYLFNASEPKLLWQYSTGNGGMGFTDLDMSNGLVLASVETTMSDSRDADLPIYVYLFNPDGKLSSSKKFVNQGIDYWGGVKVRFSALDVISAMIALKDKIILFSVK